MKKKVFAILAAAMCLLSYVNAQETRTIRLIQDDAQVKMATKMYNLKHLKATDLYIFIEAAVRRYYINSQVRALNFSANKQQTLIITTAEKFIPYVDQIISVLDRGEKKDEYGSSVYGLGYKWRVYYPKYRYVEDLIAPADVMLSGNGNVYAYHGTLWLKDDLDDVDYALDWIKYFDRPVPQANITFRYYALRESTLRDIGIDYLAWKNGPGLNLMDLAFNGGKVAWSKIFSTAMNVGSSMSWAYGGIFTAPAFDMSFIRLLQQSGEAKIVATASMNVVCAQEQATVSLDPVYNNQTKDENFASHVSASPIATDFSVNIYKPTICFHTENNEVNDMGWIPSTKEFYARNKGALVFAYDISSTDAMESNNIGSLIGNTFKASSSLKTIDLGKEQVLAQLTRFHDVEQTTGFPFLCKIPILKYIFGTTTTLREKVYLFVTMEAKLVHPDTEVKTEFPDDIRKMEEKANAEAKKKIQKIEAQDKKDKAKAAAKKAKAEEKAKKDKAKAEEKAKKDKAKAEEKAKKDKAKADAKKAKADAKKAKADAKAKEDKAKADAEKAKADAKK